MKQKLCTPAGQSEAGARRRLKPFDVYLYFTRRHESEPVGPVGSITSYIYYAFSDGAACIYVCV